MPTQGDPSGSNKGWPTTFRTLGSGTVTFTGYDNDDVVLGSLPSGWTNPVDGHAATATASGAGSWTLSAVVTPTPPGMGGGTPSTTLTIGSG